MSSFGGRFANLLEYVGGKSPSYYHTVPPVGYDPDDPTAYYLDFTARADFQGPYDEDDIPLQPTEDGRALHFPTMIAMYGLGQVEKYRSGGGVASLNRFRKAVYWIKENQAPDGSWPVEIPKTKYNLKPPFLSAMVQGLAISLLARGALIFEAERFLDTARKALAPFDKAVGQGGVTTIGEGGPWYEEYPCNPPRHVLNGFIYTLLGLYDLIRVDDNPEALRLWDAGVQSLRERLPSFDNGYWSLYQLPPQPENPATVAYHRLHINQLKVMAELTGEPLFARFRDRWEAYASNFVNRIRTLPAKLRWLGSDGF